MTNPSAADKMKLSRSRVVYRGQITKLQNKFGEIISQAVLTEDDHDTLVATIESLSEKLNIIVDMDKNILELSADDELEVVLTESDDYVTSIKQQIVKYRRQTERKFTHVVSTEIPTQTVNSTTDNHKRSVSLPKLMLKTFDGDILKWPEFNDSFVSAIDSNTTLSNVDKFQYLQGQLQGEAAESLHGLSLTNDNYVSAMSILRERYGQPHKVIDALLSNLWNLPCPDHTLVSLRDFYNQLETCIRGLSSMGKSIDQYGDVIIPLLRRKLPPVIRAQFARDIGNRTWSLDEFRASLLKEIETIQATEIDREAEHIDKSFSTAAFHTHASKFTNNPNARTKSANSSRPLSKTCVYCKGNHSHCDCTVIVDKKKRHDVILRDRLCFNCFGKHRVADCQSKFKCRFCNRRHHTSLCLNSKLAQKAVANNPDVDSSTKCLPTTEDTKVSLANLNGPILRKTAIANISSDSNSTTVNIVFDEGAQRSFITQSAADILNLKCQHTEHVQLSTFGEKTGTRSLPIANITLHTTGKFENLDINALVVPSISTPMRNYISKSVMNLPHLRNLTLAHPYSKCEHEVISILIGADYFWSLVGNHVVRGPGPTAVSSKLGYLLSGPTHSKGNPNKSARVYHVNVNLDSHRIEDMDLQRFWDLETIGIRDDEIEAPHDYTSYIVKPIFVKKTIAM